MSAVLTQFNHKAVKTALLCLFLLLGQASALSHIHDDGLQPQADCDICLKIGSGDEALLADSAGIEAEPGRFYQATNSLADASSHAITLRARAPPHIQ